MLRFGAINQWRPSARPLRCEQQVGISRVSDHGQSESSSLRCFPVSTDNSLRRRSRIVAKVTNLKREEVEIYWPMPINIPKRQKTGKPVCATSKVRANSLCYPNGSLGAEANASTWIPSIKPIDRRRSRDCTRRAPGICRPKLSWLDLRAGQVSLLWSSNLHTIVGQRTVRFTFPTNAHRNETLF